MRLVGTLILFLLSTVSVVMAKEAPRGSSTELFFTLWSIVMILITAEFFVMGSRLWRRK
jgi:hypothetical protein